MLHPKPEASASQDVHQEWLSPITSTIRARLLRLCWAAHDIERCGRCRNSVVCLSHGAFHSNGPGIRNKSLDHKTVETLDDFGALLVWHNVHQWQHIGISIAAEAMPSTSLQRNWTDVRINLTKGTLLKGIPSVRLPCAMLCRVRHAYPPVAVCQGPEWTRME